MKSGKNFGVRAIIAWTFLASPAISPASGGTPQDPVVSTRIDFGYHFPEGVLFLQHPKKGGETYSVSLFAAANPYRVKKISRARYLQHLNKFEKIFSSLERSQTATGYCRRKLSLNHNNSEKDSPERFVCMEAIPSKEKGEILTWYQSLKLTFEER
jgi:hypothetical protein